MDDVSNDCKLNPYLSQFVIKSSEGEKVDGLFCGHNKVEYINDNIYEGEMKYHMMHGIGKYTMADKVFEGDFVENRIEGKGTYTWSDGSSYTGDVLNGLRHGWGKYTCAPPNNIYYEGEWVHGQRTGKGRIVYSDLSYYDGDWENGLRDGIGVVQYPSGNRYEGNWIKNKKEGLGRMEWYDRKEIYDGNWINDKPNGYGEHFWEEDSPGNVRMKNHYKGNFVDGKREGFGTFYYSDGSKYEGYWNNNQKHGANIFYFDNGQVYVRRIDQDTYDKSPDISPFPVHYIDDMFDPKLNKTELIALHNLILRQLEKLHKIYDAISNLPDPYQPLYIYCVTNKKFNCYIKTICNSNYPFSSLIDTLKQCRLMKYNYIAKLIDGTDFTEEERSALLSTNFEEKDNSEQSPHKIISFGDFVDYLIRIGHDMYKYDPKLTNKISKIDTFFRKYIEDASDEIHLPLLDIQNQNPEFFEEMNLYFTRIYSYLIKQNCKLSTGNINIDKLPVLSLIKTMKNLNLIKEEMSNKGYLQFILGYTDIDFNDMYVFDTPIMFDEFVDFLVRLSMKISDKSFNPDDLNELVKTLNQTFNL